MSKFASLVQYCKSREISALLNGTHPRVKVKQPAPARRRRPSAPRPGKIEVPSWTAHQTLQSDTSRVTQGATFGQLFHVDSPTETNGKRSRFVDGSWGAGMAPRSAQSALARLPAATAEPSTCGLGGGEALLSQESASRGHTTSIIFVSANRSRTANGSLRQPCVRTRPRLRPAEGPSYEAPDGSPMQIAHKHHRGHAMGSLILWPLGRMSLSYRVYHSFTIFV